MAPSKDAIYPAGDKKSFVLLPASGFNPVADEDIVTFFDPVHRPIEGQPFDQEPVRRIPTELLN